MLPPVGAFQRSESWPGSWQTIPVLSQSNLSQREVTLLDAAANELIYRGIDSGLLFANRVVNSLYRGIHVMHRGPPYRWVESRNEDLSKHSPIQATKQGIRRIPG